MTHPLRVSLDVSAVPTRPAGAGRYTIELAAALDRREDVFVEIVARQQDSARWEALAPKGHVRAPAPERRPFRLAWEQVRLPRLLKGLDVDLHHSPHYTMPEAASLPRVVTLHDFSFFGNPEWYERVKVTWLRRATRVAMTHADAVICVSQTIADRLSTICPRSSEVKVIPNGVDLDRFRPSDGDDAERLRSLGVTQPYVAFVGTLEPRKDVPTLVRAFDRVAASHPDLSLVLAGAPGWGVKAVDQALAEAQHGARVVRLGYLDHEAVPVLLRQAAAVAYPSLSEGFGLPALEALACGAPLVTTTGSAMEEVAAGAALLVEPGDTDGLAGALDMLVRGDAGLAARRQSGFAVAARHTWTASADAHVTVYRSIA
ncbi:MAG: glycosyltransferase family 4 protein [Actinobacteria bacterium]|nr:glycosyltransferase family 4 protein [Actinomycetota bacterium]